MVVDLPFITIVTDYWEGMDQMKSLKPGYGLLFLSVLIVFTVAACGGTGGTQEFEYTFEEGDDGWVYDFADFPVDSDPSFYQLDGGRREMPEGIDGYGYYLQGDNHSDDLFMFLKVKAGGLEPKTTYKAEFHITLASNIPAGMMGIGGSPGESVYIKAGAITEEPGLVLDDQDWLRMNIDKGNQANGGEDMIVLGTMANPNLDPETADGITYALMDLTSEDQDFVVTSDGDGNVWFIVGTDSGFEGLTAVYFDTISVDLIE